MSLEISTKRPSCPESKKFSIGYQSEPVILQGQTMKQLLRPGHALRSSTSGQLFSAGTAGLLSGQQGGDQDGDTGQNHHHQQSDLARNVGADFFVCQKDDPLTGSHHDLHLLEFDHLEHQQCFAQKSKNIAIFTHGWKKNGKHLPFGKKKTTEKTWPGLFPKLLV